MQAAIQINPLERFSELSRCWAALGHKDELRYKFTIKECALEYECVALQIILENGLPLVAHLEEWSSRGIVREIAVVIKMVPDEQKVADEAQDHENLTGGWWDKNEE